MVVDTELARLAQDMSARCRLTGQFRLRSGQVADEYFDKYLFEADPVLLGRVVSRMST
jgi:orotate phosphoribosyltransferase